MGISTYSKRNVPHCPVFGYGPKSSATSHSLRGAYESLPRQRAKLEPWSLSDILAHLRACSDSWGWQHQRHTYTERPDPALHVSARLDVQVHLSRMDFDAALASLTQERQKLMRRLMELDEADWQRTKPAKPRSDLLRLNHYHQHLSARLPHFASNK